MQFISLHLHLPLVGWLQMGFETRPEGPLPTSALSQLQFIHPPIGSARGPATKDFDGVDPVFCHRLLLRPWSNTVIGPPVNREALRRPCYTITAPPYFSSMK